MLSREVHMIIPNEPREKTLKILFHASAKTILFKLISYPNNLQGPGSFFCKTLALNAEWPSM